MQQITIAGRIGKDAMVRQTRDGNSVAGFSVAVDTRRGQERVTTWFDCSLWGRRGEALAQYLTKGTSVAVSGELGTREHEGRTYLQVRADQVTLLGGRGGGGGDDSHSPQPGPQSGGASSAPLDDDFDSLPF